MVAILGEGNVDFREEVQLTVVFGPHAVEELKTLELKDQSIRGPIQVLSSFLIVDELIQGDRMVSGRKEDVQGHLLSFFQMARKCPVEEFAAIEVGVGILPQITQEIGGVSLAPLVKVGPDLVHVLEHRQPLGIWTRKELSSSFLCLTPGQIGVFRKGRRPAPASKRSVTEAEVETIWIAQDGGEHLRDDEHIRHGPSGVLWQTHSCACGRCSASF